MVPLLVSRFSRCVVRIGVGQFQGEGAVERSAFPLVSGGHERVNSCGLPGPRASPKVSASCVGGQHAEDGNAVALEERIRPGTNMLGN